MSTVDPDAARRARAARVPAGKDLVLPGILAFVGPAILVGSLMSMAGEPGDGDVAQSTVRLLLGAAGTTLGALATLGGFFLWLRLSIKNPRLPGWAAPLALGFGGAGIAVLSMSMRVVLASALIGIGVVFAVLAVLALRRRTARLDTDERLMRESDPVEGVVTNQGYTHFGDSSRILTAVTYAFVDAQGAQRFVQRPAVIDVTAPIVEGERVDVWYDRMNPGDEKKIVVRRRL